MSENLLAVWETAPTKEATTIVVPDGCRDLIMVKDNGKRPKWFLSALYDQAEAVSIKAGSRMIGFRMKPGVCVDEKKLLLSIPEDSADIGDISIYLDEFAYIKFSIEEALACLASDVKTVMLAACELGVSTRTLQRLIIRETNRPPAYWMMLARVRRTARALLEPISLAETANMFGYADQAHMSREFKRWFGVSPSVMRNTPGILNHLHDTGYG